MAILRYAAVFIPIVNWKVCETVFKINFSWTSYNIQYITTYRKYKFMFTTSHNQGSKGAARLIVLVACYQQLQSCRYEWKARMDGSSHLCFVGSAAPAASSLPDRPTDRPGDQPGRRVHLDPAVNTTLPPHNIYTGWWCYCCCNSRNMLTYCSFL